MKVIDNFLPDNVFQQISDNVMGEMPWTFLDTVSKPTEKIKLQIPKTERSSAGVLKLVQRKIFR